MQTSEVVNLNCKNLQTGEIMTYKNIYLPMNKARIDLQYFNLNIKAHVLALTLTSNVCSNNFTSKNRCGNCQILIKSKHIQTHIHWHINKLLH